MINSITIDFIQKVKKLEDKGVSIKDIINGLKWNKTSFSLVKAGKRDVPVDIWEKLHTVFKIENPLVTSMVKELKPLDGIEGAYDVINALVNTVAQLSLDFYKPADKSLEDLKTEILSKSIDNAIKK